MLKKPNKPADIGSYRPISLSSYLAKCMEKVVLFRINHLEKHKMISKFQSGFSNSHGTKDHILRLTQNVINDFNRNKNTSAVKFDMEKAFDRVWHQGLIYTNTIYHLF